MNKRNKVSTRRAGGFTLVELLVVVLILGALAGIAVPRITSSAQAAKSSACETNMDIINSQAELYKAIEGSYPADIDALTGNADYFPEGTPDCPLGGTYSLNSNHRAVCTPASSASEPEPEPEPEPVPVPTPLPRRPPPASPFM